MKFIGEKTVKSVKLDELYPFPDHPFMDRDSAIIAMVDVNIQRAGRKTKVSSSNRDQDGYQFEERKTVEIIADESGDSKSQVQRYLRLNELQPTMLQMVDDKKLGLTQAVEMSYLSPEEQTKLLDAMDAEQSTQSLSQAKRMKEMSKAGSLTEDAIFSVMREKKRPEQSEIPVAPKEIVLPLDSISKFFPKNYKIHDMERMIYKLLDSWQKKKQKQHGER